MKKPINYKGRCVKPTHKHTVGFQHITRHIGSMELARACDEFLKSRGINPKGVFQS